eukprot:gene3294-3512_t
MNMNLPSNDLDWQNLVDRCTRRFQRYNTISGSHADAVIRIEHWVNGAFRQITQQFTTITQNNQKIADLERELATERQTTTAQAKTIRHLTSEREQLKTKLQVAESLLNNVALEKGELEKELDSVISKLEKVQINNEKMMTEIAELKSKLCLAEDNYLAEKEYGKTLYKIFLNTQAEAKNYVSEKVFQLIFPHTPAPKTCTSEEDVENQGFDPEAYHSTLINDIEEEGSVSASVNESKAESEKEDVKQNV